ncbi:hypothetical protein D3C83_177210 [compost metagenome]
MLDLRQRIFGEGSEIVFLKLVFERDPVVPDVVERAGEHVRELRRIKGLGTLRPPQPFDRLFDPVGQREIVEEAGTV